MAQIENDGHVIWEPVDTPGVGQRCLYFAALISLGKEATDKTSLELKQKVHEELGRRLEANASDKDSNLRRDDLRRAHRLTSPGTYKQASHEVLPALATVLQLDAIRVHENMGVVYEVDALDVNPKFEKKNRKILNIGHAPGHFYALTEVPKLNDFL